MRADRFCARSESRYGSACRYGACVLRRGRLRDVLPDSEWQFIAVAPRSGDLKDQIRAMLTAAAREGVAEQDIKIDTICARGEAEDSVRVWVRSGATDRPPAP